MERSQSNAADKLQTATLTFTNGTTSGWVLIRKKRKRFNLPGSSQWKRRYLTLNGSILATFNSEAAYEKASYIAENKHTVSIDPSCTCAPSTETTEGSMFILSTPQDSATLTCVAYNRREMQQWVTAIGRAIRWSIDTDAAEQILQRHPGGGGSNIPPAGGRQPAAHAACEPQPNVHSLVRHNTKLKSENTGKM